MFAKRLFYVCAAILYLSASEQRPAQADETRAGKWIMGAGLFSGRGEISLMRGLTERTLLGIGVSVDRDEQDLDPAEGPLLIGRGDYRAWNVAAGPRLRRLTRSSELSPYWDVFVNGLASERRSGAVGVEQIDKSHGFGGGVGLGVEWETPWRFAVAAHSDLVTMRWQHVESEIRLNGVLSRSEGNSYQTKVELSPGLFARFYF